MKIEIENFGPIKDFRYDLDKDIIITYGDNNIGKSYAMQIVYLLLKTFVNSVTPKYLYFDSYYYVNHEKDELDTEIELMVSSFLKANQESQVITDKITNLFYKQFELIYLPDFNNSCQNTVGNYNNILEQKPILKVVHDKYDFCIDLEEKKICGEIHDIDIRLKRSTSSFHKSKKYDDHLDIYVVNETDTPSSRIKEEIFSMLSAWVKMVSSEFPIVFFFPASRSGIYSGMNAFGSIIAELSKNRAYLTKKIELPGISEPISDYFISLSNIKAHEHKEFEPFYGAIERDILKGKVIFDKNKNALLYQPDGMKNRFEMTEVSSMVSEVSPIVAFLKYILRFQETVRNTKKAILFIEEPEAHLHPNNQIALIEIFASLSQKDIKMIISSHSNYIFNKMNNLVLDRAIDYRMYQPILLVNTDEGSISKNMHIDELGADDSNFVDVSERLYNEREMIINRINNEDNGDD